MWTHAAGFTAPAVLKAAEESEHRQLAMFARRRRPDPSRRWLLNAKAVGSMIQIVNAKTGKCLTIAGGTSADKNVVALQFDCDGDLSRAWLLKDLGGAFQIRNAKTQSV